MVTGKHARGYGQEDSKVTVTASRRIVPLENQVKIEVYGTQFCGYCTAARMLLKKRGLQYKDISVSTDDRAREEMLERGKGSSVPQILINDQAIGGFDELVELDRSGDLDRLLALRSDTGNTQD